MSGLLTLDLDTAPFERARADVAFVLFFEDERPLRGSAGRADWRLCGHLSTLIEEGRLAGAPGEAALIPTAGGLRAPLLVAVGAGPVRLFDEEAWTEAARGVARRALGLGQASVVLALPPAGPARMGLRQRVEGLIRGAVRALEERPGELRLRIVASREEAARTAELLRGLRLREIPDSVTVRLPTRRPEGGGPEQPSPDRPPPLR